MSTERLEPDTPVEEQNIEKALNYIEQTGRVAAFLLRISTPSVHKTN